MNSSFPIRLWNLWLAVLCALLVFLVGLHPAQAQIQRAFGARYSADLRGDIVLTGNTVIRPTSTTATSNNNQAVAYADIDGSSTTTNSSSAQLKLPTGVTGSNIIFARLYWSGRLSATSLPSTQTISFSASGAAAGYQTYTATANVPTAAESQLTNFTIPGYSGTAYSAWVDVTTQMKSAGATPTLLAGGLSGDLINDALGAYAGWTVVVVYRQSSDFVRQLRVFDGLGIVNGTNALPITLSGFRTPDSGAFTMRFGAVVNEGDKGIVGDALQFNGTALSDAINPANDYFNSTVSQDGTLFTSELNPQPSNSTIFGMDADRTSLTGPSALIGSGATSANLNFTTSGDVYFPTTFTTSIPTFEIQGRVFTDPNYSGGAGRAFDASKGMGGAAGATVELYNTTTGAFVKSTTTDANGFYYFYTLGTGNYSVRVVNSTVKSNRPNGATATGLLPVQTYRTDATGNLDSYGSGTATGVTNEVGGAFPNADDPAASTTTLPAGAQTVSKVVLGDGAVSNVDFGFNFDTIVNARDSGQGSLRQFIINSNTLGNTGLAQEGLTAGRESSIFMIPTSDPRFTNGVARILLASALPSITDADTSIAGEIQTAKIGDTNARTLYNATSVGTIGSSTASVAAPEVVVSGGGTLSNLMSVASSGAIISNIGFAGQTGTATGNSTIGALVLLNGTTGATITGNAFGPYTSFSDPGAESVNDAVVLGGSAGATVANTQITNNGFGFVGKRAIVAAPNGASSNVNGLTVTGNTFSISGSQMASNQGDGEAIGLSSNYRDVVITGNLFNRIATASTSVFGDNAIEINYSTTNSAVASSNAQGVLISGNTITAARGNGIALNDSAASLVNSSGKTTIIQNNIVALTTQTSATQGGNGLVVNAQNVRISRNSIYDNDKLGIDLGATLTANDGVSPNDGVIVPTAANQGVDYPIFSTVTTGTNSLTISGYVGNAATGIQGAGPFTIEVFVADSTPANQSGAIIAGDGRSVEHGEGRTYIGSFTTDANGVFTNQTLAYTLAANSQITATATNSAGNTSEFSNDLPEQVAPGVTVKGRVFEDVNYSGGAGRAYDSTKGMKGVNGVRVELYNADGTFNTFTTTATLNGEDGFYSFPGLPDGVYYTRVVSGTVTSSRAPTVTGLLPVQTFQVADETTDTAANPTAISTRVGGRFPAQTGSGANTTNATLNTSTFVFSTGGIARSVSRVQIVNGADGSGPDGFAFGFNFDTIVNTNDSGQGSLRQFVLNSNALPNTGLAQEGLAAGVETSIFMIPSATDPLGRAADPNFANGVAKITLASGISITGTNAGSTAIDGTRQTSNIGDTNAGTFGTGGTVGVQNVALPTLARPEVEIYGPTSIPVGLDIAANGAVVKGVSMWGFGASGDNNSNATIRVGADSTASFTPPTITQVLLGASAVAGTGGVIAVPSAYGKGDLVRANGVDGGAVSNSILAYGGGKGVALQGGADGWTVQGNEIRNDSRDSSQWDGVDAQVANTQVIGNLIYNIGGVGIDSYSSSGGAVISNNTVRNNGLLCSPTAGESAGIRSYGTGNSITLNIVANNYGAGVLVQSTATSLISRNSIYGNGSAASSSSTTASGQIGIDLLKTGDDVGLGTSPFVSPNDAGDTDTGGNGLLNFPVMTSASIADGQLTLSGFAPAGSTVEVFVAAPDPTGFGEGQTFAFSFVEGSASDTNTGTGAYSASTLQGLGYSASTSALAGSETTANRFRVVVPVGSISSNSVLTATATVSGATSEFSPNLGVTPTISGTVYLDTNSNARQDAGEGGVNLTGYYIKLVPNGSTTASRAVAVATDGTYTLRNVTPGSYSLVLDDNATLSDVTPSVPAGYTATEAPGGTRPVSIANTSIASQNFGLYAGYTLSGTVFEDNGAGGGTANDGVQNGGEPNLGGVTVQLKSGATVIATATTAADGSYSLSIPASYSGQTLTVVETNPTAYVSSGGSAGNSGGTYTRTTDTVSFQFNTTNGTLAGVNFADVRGATLDNDGTKVGIRGGSVVYPHVFTANTAGTVSFSLAQNATPAPGWSVALYNDLNGNGALDAGEPQITSSAAPITTTATGKINLLVINYVPQNAPDGSQDKITLTANFSPAVGGTNAALPAQTLTRGDLTTVGPQSGLTLSKAVDKTTAKSGDLITYTITYTNTGNAPISNLVINDTTPAFTSFSSATYTQPLPNTLTGCTVAAPSVNGTGAISWTFTGTLAQGASSTVKFVVKLN